MRWFSTRERRDRVWERGHQRRVQCDPHRAFGSTCARQRPGGCGQLSDVDAWKQIRQQNGSFSGSIDLKVDVAGPYAVAVAVLNGADGDAALLFLKTERDRRGATDGLCARERHSRRQISGGSETA